MKITVENQDRKACKHEVGKVYWNGVYHFLIVEKGLGSLSFINLEASRVASDYTTMAELDAVYPDDVLVDAELIIREMKGKYENQT